MVIYVVCYIYFHFAIVSDTTEGVAVVDWLSSWLAEQEVWGSIPGLAT